MGVGEHPIRKRKLKEYGVWSVTRSDRIQVFKDAWILGLESNIILLEGREVHDEDIFV